MTFIWFTTETRTLYEPRPVSSQGRMRVHPSEAVSPVTEAVPAVGQERPRNQGYSTAPLLERTRALVAKDIMSSPVLTLAVNNLFADAWRIVRERGFRHIPILSEDGRPIGIIADRDLLTALAEIETVPGSLTLEQLMGSRLDRFMHSPLLTAEPAASIREVARVMFEEHVGCVPVIDENEQIQGVITRSDILRAVLNDAPMELWV